MLTTLEVILDPPLAARRVGDRRRLSLLLLQSPVLWSPRYMESDLAGDR